LLSCARHQPTQASGDSDAAVKTTPIIGRVGAAVARNDKVGVEIIPPDGRTPDLPQQVAAVPGPKEALTLDLGGGVTMDFVLIRPGEFLMGSPDSEANRSDDEGPQHNVRITKPFYMGKYEVTQAQFLAVTGRDPAYFKGADNPVESVSWSNAEDFCRKLGQEAGREARLPTEAEWEYACRAGTTTAFSFGDGTSGLGDHAWYSGNSGGKSHPVGQKEPNAWGLYDMHGNVWEWCQDRYDNHYYQATPASDPTGPPGGYSRVLRGGSWNYALPDYCRSANRGGFSGVLICFSRGFRVVVSAQ